MHRLYWMVPALAILLTVSCGGGGDSSGGGGVVPGPGGGSTIYAGDFDRDPNPGNNPPGINSVSLTGTANSNIVTVTVEVTQTADVYSTSFDLVYNSAIAQFVSWQPGFLLESGGQQPTYQVNAQQSGRVIVGVSREGSSTSGADAGNPAAVVHLSFRVIAPGASQIAFDNAHVENPSGIISGISFWGGTITAQ